jgi:hypothetical protein
MNEMALEIDLNQDGSTDSIITATNQTTPSNITFDPFKTSIYTGGNQVKITLGVRDQFGTYAPNGTPVALSTTLGSLSITDGHTSGGLLEFVITSGNQAGIATITATSGELQESIDIVFINHKVYLPAIIE